MSAHSRRGRGSCDGNETMRLVLVHLGSSRQHSASTSACVQQLTHPQHGGLPALDHVTQRSFPAEHGIFIGQLQPPVGEFLAVQNVECLKDPRQYGNARQAVLIETCRGPFASFRRTRHWTCLPATGGRLHHAIPTAHAFSEMLGLRQVPGVFGRLCGKDRPAVPRRRQLRVGSGLPRSLSRESPYMEYLTSNSE